MQLIIICKTIELEGNSGWVAHVCLMNYHGNVVYASFVKPKLPVTNVQFSVNGLKAASILEGKELSQVQEEVAELINGRILIGYNVSQWLKLLYLSHPFRLVRDFSRYKPMYSGFQSNRVPPLSWLTEKHLQIRLPKPPHSSVLLGRAVLHMYKKFSEKWEFAVNKKRASKRKRK